MTSQPKVSLASDNRLFISYLQVYDRIRRCIQSAKGVQWLGLSRGVVMESIPVQGHMAGIG